MTADDSVIDIVVPPGYLLVKLPSVASTDTGVLRALAGIWSAIAAQDDRVPRGVVFDLQPARTSGCSTVEWDTSPVIVLNLKDSVGEKLHARAILQTLLHLAAHGAATGVRGSEGRYHSVGFADAARKVGLDVSETRTPGVGYQIDGLARGTLTRYEAEIRTLDKAIADWNPALLRKTRRDRISYSCQCDPPRRVLMYPQIAELGDVVCSVCRAPFEPRG